MKDTRGVFVAKAIDYISLLVFLVASWDQLWLQILPCRNI